MPKLPVILLLLSALLGGCATRDKTQDELSSAALLYQEGKEALQSGYYETAIEKFEQLETRYPFGEYAQQAQLDMAYAYYKSDNPASAVAAAERFLRTYPRHPHADYAYYIRGLANFAVGGDAIDKLLGEDPARRDPRPARDAFRYFAELVERYPDSPYTVDALQRMIYLRNYLARHELHVARFYMQRGAYVAALNRTRNVLETYAQTTATPEALRLMVDAYDKLGLKQLAAETRQVLELNYPERQKQGT
ncbi:MAG: outer membrane protein assembly factor BamD [Gammaproteobacteria bacterium]